MERFKNKRFIFACIVFLFVVLETSFDVVIPEAFKHQIAEYLVAFIQ